MAARKGTRTAKSQTTSALRSAESGVCKTSELLEMAAPYNPREISADDYGSLRKSIRYFGFVEPVVVNRRFSRIVGGHQRVRAAKDEGYETLPVMFVDLDEPSEKQLNVALNRISGDWDDDKLRELLTSIEAEGADLSLTGFSDGEIAKIFRNAVDEEDENGSGDPELGSHLEYRVVVDCKDENQQAELISQLEQQGWICRPLIS